jgi:DNA (cytosine-5)-methyltransferase 1
MEKPLILDLFSCEGIGAKGYQAAGFDTIGVDLKRLVGTRYPGPFILGDAVGLLALFVASGGMAERWMRRVVAVHASPPCQAYSITKHSHDVQHPELVEPVRDLLVASGLPYVIENVVGAPLLDPVTLCGGMFDLTAKDTEGTPLRLERHRLFETNWGLPQPEHVPHDRSVQVGGVYGAGNSDRAKAKIRRGGYTPAKSVRAALIGVDPDEHTMWGLSQSIPPAYANYVGEHLMRHLRAVSDARPTAEQE